LTYTKDGSCPFCGNRIPEWLGETNDGEIKCYCEECGRTFLDSLNVDGSPRKKKENAA